MSETVVSESVKRSRISLEVFVNAWNSEKTLEQIAKEHNVKVQTLNVRAQTIRKKLEEGRNSLVKSLNEEKSKAKPDNTRVTQLQNQISKVDAFKLRDRKVSRKSGLDAILSLVK